MYAEDRVNPRPDYFHERLTRGPSYNVKYVNG